MNKLTVTLETVTPLFMGGADQQPELRPASFRGALRFWWRALWGGAHGDDWQRMREDEAKVFGDTRQASAVIVRVRELESAKAIKSFYSQGKGSPPPDRTSSGHDYLLWSMKEWGDKPNRRGFYPGHWARFDLILQARPGATNGKDALQQASAALWLLTRLGGLGSRARRTAGSLAVVSSKPSLPDLPDFKLPQSPSGLHSHLENGITRISRLFAGNNASWASEGQQPVFNVLHPRTSRVWILSESSPWTHWERAVERLGAKMRDFRNRTNPDHNGVLDWIQEGNAPDQVERSVFGLPLPFRYSGIKGNYVVEGQEHDRRPSPLWLRVVRLKPNHYVGVATLFKSRYLPGGERLHIKHKPGSVSLSVDYTLVEKFISTQFPQRREVHYA